MIIQVIGKIIAHKTIKKHYKSRRMEIDKVKKRT